MKAILNKHRNLFIIINEYYNKLNSSIIVLLITTFHYSQLDNLKGTKIMIYHGISRICFQHILRMKNLFKSQKTLSLESFYLKLWDFKKATQWLQSSGKWWSAKHRAPAFMTGLISKCWRRDRKTIPQWLGDLKLGEIFL